ncbi:MAG: hypothetical protein CMN05_11070 [Roseibacillus sp.]|nr:hypothetical protein [Roseibacillus sp.]
MALSPAIMAEEADCTKLSDTVKKLVGAKPDHVLEIVERQTAATPACSCEVVKAAIVATEADRKLVGQIVATAIEAAPDKMRIITTCAIAVAPDALQEINAILAKLDPKALAKKGNDPVGGAKNAGDAIVSNVKNPLDGPYLIPGLPPIHPPLIPAISTPPGYTYEIDGIDPRTPEEIAAYKERLAIFDTDGNGEIDGEERVHWMAVLEARK